MILRVFLFVVIASTAFSSCTGPKKEKTPDDLSREFMELYKKNGARAVYFFFEGNKFDPGVAGTEYAAKKLDTVVQELGNYRDYELLTCNKAGNSLVLLSYMVKYDREPIRFNLYYYKPDKEWLPYHYTFDTDLRKELDVSGEMRYLNKTYSTNK